MRPLDLTAATAVSAAGHGRAALLDALLTRRSGLAPNDFPDIDLPCHIGRVADIEDVRLPPPLARFDCRNNRLASLALDTDGFAAAVAGAVRRHGAERVGVVLGTSTSGILATEEAYRRRDTAGRLPAGFDFLHTHDLFSVARFVRSALGLKGPASVISTACSSGAKTFGDAVLLIEAGICDAVVVGGVDSLCGTTLYGFAALELLAAGRCRPFAADRDGISIGEAAALVLLEADGDAPVRLQGVASSTDAHHMTSPHPEGQGAARAMRAALEVAGTEPGEIDYVNFHGTGTRSNDAVEDRAVAGVVGDAPWCSSTKGWTGHTLATSGALEAVIAALCIEHGLIPGCLGVDRPDPSFATRIAVENRRQPVRRVLSNSFGFGGSNSSLVLDAQP